MEISTFNVLLLVLCPIGALLGSFAQAIVHSIDLNGPPVTEEQMEIASKDLQEKRGMWLGLRMILGGILGFVVALYFLGSIQENITTLGKIMALSILVGYSAPKLWEVQDQILEKKIKKLIEKEEI